MTQAYNLSQLANNLNSSGQLDATDGLVNAVPVANGGTGASTAASARSNLSVPSATGSGASGTWSIDISGNSATSSVASNPASGGSFITSSNIGSQSVSYATTSGNGGVTSVNGSTGAVTVPSAGVGQTWQNLTASRATNTPYTNSTGKPIQVCVYSGDNTGLYYFKVDGVNVAIISAGSGTYAYGNCSVIVPNGSTYQTSGGSITLWSELR